MEKIKKYMVVPSSKKLEAVTCAKEIKRELEKKHHVVVQPSLDSAGMFENNADIFIAVGGDGTMLSTVGRAPFSYVSEGLFFGLNFGDTGFMMNDVIPAKDAVERILQKKFDVISFPLLKITSNGKTAFALNDFFFNRIGPQACKFYARINGKLICENPISADGGVIATPLGSTGYSLSEGGPIISHNAQVICLTGIAVGRPRGLLSRILSFGDEVEIEILYFDQGQVRVFKDNSVLAGFGPKIKIKMSDKFANLAFWKGTNFSKRLNDKILTPQR